MPSLGTHRILDYWGCSFETLDDLEQVRKMFEEGLRLSNATVIDVILHKFAPQGVTGIAAIAESHVSIHTWPELGYAAVDVFSCGSTMNTDRLLKHFESVLQPTERTETIIERGEKIRLARTP
jgi:S-adenosylmethionine decarboxylase